MEATRKCSAYGIITTKSKNIIHVVEPLFKEMKLAFISFFLLGLLLIPSEILAADVLQVRGSTLLQIGDRNRSYTVKLACIKIDSQKESAAIDSLKTIFRKQKRVNLRPQGSTDGVLLARVISIKDNLDISQILSEKGLGNVTC